MYERRGMLSQWSHSRCRQLHCERLRQSLWRLFLGAETQLAITPVGVEQVGDRNVLLAAIIAAIEFLVLPQLSGTATPHVQTIRFTNLRYFISQPCDAFFDGILRDDRLAPHTGWIGVARRRFSIINRGRECKRPVATSKSSGRKRYARSSTWSPESGMARPPRPKATSI
jgi:hypothetical protein